MSEALTLDKFLDALDRRVIKHLSGLPTFHQGVVQGYDASTNQAQVSIDDDPTLLQAAVIGPWTPSTGDLVEVRVQKGYLVVHGPTAGASVTTPTVEAEIVAGNEYWRSVSAMAATSATTTITHLMDTQVAPLQIIADGVSYYRVVFVCRPMSDAVATTMDVAVLDGGNSNPTIASPIVAQASTYLDAIAGAGSVQLVVEQDVLFTTGLHTLQPAFWRTVGTGNVSVSSSTNEYKELTVFNPRGMQGPIGNSGPAGPPGPLGPPGPAGASYNTTINSPVAGTVYPVVHALNTTTPLVQLWDAANGQLLSAEVTVVDANNANVIFLTTIPHSVNVVVAAGTPGGVARKYAAALAGTVSPETVTHNLNTQDVLVMVHNGSTPYNYVEVDWTASTVNTVVVSYNPNLGSGYRVVVMG